MNNETGNYLEQQNPEQSTSSAALQQYSNDNYHQPIMNTNFNREERKLQEHSKPPGNSCLSNVSYESQESENELGSYHEDVDLYDSDLSTMATKLFNQHLKKKGIIKKSKRDIELRHLRRTLKNRGYAAECRDKKLEENDQDEKDITELLIKIADEAPKPLINDEGIEIFEKQLETEYKMIEDEVNFLMSL